MTEQVSPGHGDAITSPIIYLCAIGLGLAIAALVVIAIPVVLEAIPVALDFFD